MGLLIPLLGQTRSAAQSVACLANLRQIHTGLMSYAADNAKRLPDPQALQVSWEEAIRKYLPGVGVFQCKADEELFPSVGSSYDWRDTGRPETTLAGRFITDVERTNAVLAFEALPGWHAAGRMNAVLLNGAASEMDQTVCLADLQRAIRRPSTQPAPTGRGGVIGRPPVRGRADVTPPLPSPPSPTRPLPPTGSARGLRSGPGQSPAHR